LPEYSGLGRANSKNVYLFGSEPTMIRAVSGAVLLLLVHTTAVAAAAPRAALSSGRKIDEVGTPTDWKKLHRSLHLPRLSPGAACPRSPRHIRPEPPPYGAERLVGPGPAYPAFYSTPPYDPSDPSSIVHYGGGRVEGGWYYLKVLWLTSPHYRGPLLIRGRQLDGPNELRFDMGASPPREIRIPAGRGELRHGWKDRASYSRFRAPGCYGYQLDGLSFSRIIVFPAAP
jgi:hypothetical protein